MKCLVMIRVSTEQQRVEDQHNEMEVFCRSEGYDELVYVEDKGASAIKLNDSYRMMIDQVKEEIERDPDIRCFAVWELSRAFRNELVFQEVKQFLVERKVQFLVKNPYLKLLNPDGSVSPGMELATTVMATLAKQEMELKQERFKRAKSAMRAQGKFTGGRCVKYGYRVDEKGYIVLDDETAPIVRTIFEMYSTGKYSIRSLFNELKESGYGVSLPLMYKMVADMSYVDGRYPQMISTELWEKVSAVRKNNFLSIPKGKRYAFGSGIFKCSQCGCNMIAEGAQYRCRHHNKVSAPPHCPNGLTIRVENLDGLLWWVAVLEHTEYLMREDADKERVLRNEIAALERKIDVAQTKISSTASKRKKIVDTYLEDLLTKEERDIKLKRLNAETKELKETILSYQEEIDSLKSALASKADGSVDVEWLKGIYLGVKQEGDLKRMQEIVRQQIVRVTSVAEWFGSERDKRAVRQNAQLITVQTRFSGIKKFIYVARKYKRHYFWIYKGDGMEHPLLTFKKIIREPGKQSEKRAYKKISDWYPESVKK